MKAYLKFYTILVAVFLMVTVYPGHGLTNSEADDELPPKPTVSAETAVLIEMNSGKVLYDLDMHKEMHPASTTKILTALLLMEHASLLDTVTVSDNAWGVPGSSLYLDLDEEISVRNLLYGILLRSANDGAVAAAEHVAGSEEGFARLMTERAQELGAENSNFTNPHGLTDEDHQTTAYDLAMVTSAALENPLFRHIVTTRTQTIPWPGESEDRVLHNRNELVRNYEGAIGVKTGYTRTAGPTFVGAAERDDMTLIAVVLSSDFGHVFDDAAKLLDYGFDHYSMKTLVREGEAIDHLKVEGSEHQIALLADSELKVPVSNGKTSVTTEINITEPLIAPVSTDEQLGDIVVYVGEQPLARTALFADQEVPAKVTGNWWGIVLIAAGCMGCLVLIIRIFKAAQRKKNRRKTIQDICRKY